MTEMDTVRPAEASGFAAEWAAFLEANGCGYRDGC
jgi:hypothetical protein